MSGHITRDEGMRVMQGLTPAENDAWGKRMRELLLEGHPLDYTIRQSLTEISEARGNGE